MISQMRFSSFFAIIIMVAWTYKCQSMTQSPTSPPVSSSPKTLYVYDQLKHSIFLFKQLQETPHIIQECIQSVDPTEVEDWQIPKACTTWDPTQLPVSPATLQGCYMEFCDEIPRALITPWGRRPLFEGKIFTPFVRKMIPELLKRITIAPESTLTSYWKTDIDTYPTTFFDVITFNNITLEKPTLREGCQTSNAKSITKSWNYVLKCYKKEQKKKLEEISLQEKKRDEAVLKEIEMIFAEGNSSPKNSSPLLITHFIPIKNRKKD